MYSGAEDPRQRQEIQSSLKSIVETSESWLKRLRRRQWEVRLASSFLTAILVFFATLIVDFIGVLISTGLIRSAGSPTFPASFNFLFHQQSVLLLLAGPAFLAAPAAAIITYLLLRRRHRGRLKELSSLIAQMKTKIQEGGQQQQRNIAGSVGEGIAGDALSLADKILMLLPGVVRKRNQDSLLFGVVAFVLAGVFGQNPAVAILVGVIVWLYFRYETGKTYEREISRLEEQKRVFEHRKNDFLATL